jgi:hypothetical protein
MRAAGSDASPVDHPLQGVARLAQALLGGYQEYRADQDIKAEGQRQRDMDAQFLAPLSMPQQAAPDPMQGAPAPQQPVQQRAMAPAEYEPLIQKAAQETGIPPQILTGLLAQESGFRPDARNPRSSATGIAQVLDATAAQPGYGLPPLSPEARLDPAQAIPWAARYLAARGGALGVTDWNDPQQAERGLRAYGENTPEYAQGVLRRAGMGGDAIPAQMPGQAAPGAMPQPRTPDASAVYMQQAQQLQQRAQAAAAAGRTGIANLLMQQAQMAMQMGMARGPAPSENERLLQAAGLQPGTPDYQAAAQRLLDARARGQNVNVTTSGGTTYGSQPPADYRYVREPLPGGGETLRMEVIPGSKTDLALKDKEQKEGRRAESAQRSGAIVIEDIGRIENLVKNSNLPTTGMGATFLSNIPGTGAADVNKLLEGLRANISFDRLNQMRQESATGGALGNVTVRELELLAATYGSLEQSQSKDQFTTNLRRLRKVYMDIIHGQGKWEETEPAEAPPAPPPGFVPVPGR